MGRQLNLTKEEGFGILLGQIWELSYQVLKRVKPVATLTFNTSNMGARDIGRLSREARQVVKDHKGEIVLKLVDSGEDFHEMIFVANVTALMLYEQIEIEHPPGDLLREGVLGLLYGYSIDDIHKHLKPKRRQRGSTKR